MEELKISFSDIEKIELYGGKVRKTASQVRQELAKQGKVPDYIINAGMYDTRTGLTACDTIINGELINGGNYTNKGVAIIGNKLKEMTTEEAKAKGYDFLGGSPNLMWNNVVNIDSKGISSSFINTLTKRIALAWTDYSLIVYFPKQATNLPIIADRLRKWGYPYGINLDGGGSVRVEDKNGNVLNNATENRPNSTWLLIYLKKQNENNGGGDQAQKYVIIDSGHNKYTAGKRSFDETLLEYEFNYDVSKRIKTILDKHGVKTEILQPQDKTVNAEINARISYINKMKPDLVLSVHANAAGKTWNTANGWEALCYEKGEGKKGYEIATLVQKHSVPYLGLVGRGIKESDGDVGIIEKTYGVPVVLVEHGFYTNKEEVKLLKTSEFRQKCAIADAKGILEYLGIEYTGEEIEEKPKKLYKVQVGAFSIKENAERLKKDLEEKGYECFIVEKEV